MSVANHFKTGSGKGNNKKAWGIVLSESPLSVGESIPVGLLRDLIQQNRQELINSEGLFTNMEVCDIHEPWTKRALLPGKNSDDYIHILSMKEISPEQGDNKIVKTCLYNHVTDQYHFYTITNYEATVPGGNWDGKSVRAQDPSWYVDCGNSKKPSRMRADAIFWMELGKRIIPEF